MASSQQANSSPDEVPFFQDVVLGISASDDDDDDGGDRGGGVPDSASAAASDPADALFELANVPYVGFRVRRRRRRRGSRRGGYGDGGGGAFGGGGGGGGGSGGSGASSPPRVAEVVVRQDGSVLEHTGGIVWETSYLLATFLLGRYGDGIDGGGPVGGGRPLRRRPLGRVLEVGAGTGLLGIALAASGLCLAPVVLTEAEEAMGALRANVGGNVRRRDTGGNPPADLPPLPARPSVRPGGAVARRLRWDHLRSDVEDGGDDLRPRSFDTIVATDVVFAPDLVRPMLETLATMAHDRTVVYLCLQVRCADSHSKLLGEAPGFGFRVDDATDELRGVPGCLWGLDMECKLLRLVVVTDQRGRPRSKRRPLDRGKSDREKKRQHG